MIGFWEFVVMCNFGLDRVPVTMVALCSALLVLSGCGNDQYGQLTDPQFDSMSSSHDSSTARQSQSPISTPSQNSAGPTKSTSPSHAPSQPTTPPTLPTPNPVTQPTSTKKPSSPYNLKRDPLPAYAYTWKKDQHDNWDFSDRCVFPGEDGSPMSTLTYGTMLDELFQVREFVKWTYIFRDEVIDLDPRKFVKPFTDFDSHFKNMTDKDSYFQQLRSKVTLKDGLPRHGMYEFIKHKDAIKNFNDRSYYVPNKPKPVNWFGVIWSKRSENPPREFVVKFVGLDSPGLERLNGEPKVKRGDKLVKINDIDFVSATSSDLIKKIEQGLNPDNISDVTKFELIDRDTKKIKTVFLNPISKGHSSKEWSKILPFSRIIDTENGLVGYINLGNSFTQFDQIYESIKEFKDKKVKDVVIDIRYYDRKEIFTYSSKAEPMLLYTILGKKNTDGKQFRYRHQRFGSDHLRPFRTPFFSKCLARSKDSQQKEFCDASMITYCELPGRCRNYAYAFDLKTLDLNRVYILTSEETCHIGELIVNAPLGIDVEVVQVGSQTCGKPYESIGRNNCGIRYGFVGVKFTNEKGEGDYIKGFKPKNTKSKYGIEIPGCFVQDDFTKDLGSKQEALLAAALQYRKDGTCPKVP